MSLWKTDPKAYWKAKNAERRARCKRLGLCQHCTTDKARNGKTHCQACEDIGSARRKLRNQTTKTK